MRTRIQYANDSDMENYEFHTVYITIIPTGSENAEDLMSSLSLFANDYDIECLGCPDTHDNGEHVDTFSQANYNTKAEFMKEFRDCIKDWKKSLKQKK